MEYIGKLYGKVGRSLIPLTKTTEDVERTESLLRETVMRSNLAMPETEQDLKWFDEGVTHLRSGDFFERLVRHLDLGNIDDMLK